MLHSRWRLKLDRHTLEQSTRNLEVAYNTDFTQYVIDLTKEHVNPTGSLEVRIAAGIALKNALTAKDAALQQQKYNLWLGLDVTLRDEIKKTIVGNLSSTASAQSAQVIAAIAIMELPLNGWPDLIDQLLVQVAAKDSTENQISSSLLTIGYICEVVDPQILQNQSDKILTAVITGASPPNTLQVRRVALQSFSHCISFARANFERTNECNMIMQVLCESANLENSESGELAFSINFVAFQCFNRIVDVYYTLLKPYMNALCFLAIKGLSAKNEPVVMQAIEFWSTLFEKEGDLLAAESDAKELGAETEINCARYSFDVVEKVLPMLFDIMRSLEEDVDEDEWCPAMAASLCVQFLCGCVGSKAYAASLTLIETYIQHEDWENRNAAILAFGCILEGHDCASLAKPASKVLPILINAMSDSSDEVRDSAAWTLGRICERVAYRMPAENHVEIVNALLSSVLTQRKHTSATCCWGLLSFADQMGAYSFENPTSATSPMFEQVTRSLLQFAIAPETENSTRTSVYETLSMWISKCAQDCIAAAFQIAVNIIDLIQEKLEAGKKPANPDFDIFQSLFSVLNSIIRRMRNEVSNSPGKIPDLILNALTAIHSESTPASITANSKEEVLLCLGSLAAALGNKFLPYADALLPFVYKSIIAKEDVSVCKVSIGVLIDVCKALEQEFIRYMATFLSALIQVLSSPQVDPSLKPPILSCFGELALAVGPVAAQELVKPMMEIFTQAAFASAEMSNESEYAESLREAIIEAISSVINCLSTGGNVETLLPYATFFLDFIRKATSDIAALTLNAAANPDRLFSEAAGILGDLALAMGSMIRSQLQQPWVYEFLSVLMKAGNTSEQTKATASWAKEQIISIKQ